MSKVLNELEIEGRQVLQDEKQDQLKETTASTLDEEQASKQQEEDKEKLQPPYDKIIQDDRLKIEMKQTDGFLRNNFTTQQNLHLNNSIRFADTKAGVLSGANGLVLTYSIEQLSTATGVSKVSIVLGLFCLVVSILYSLWVVYPRFMNSKDTGLVYWEHITNYKKDEYMHAITEGDSSELLRNSIENNYTQAIILTKKFKKLEIGFKFCLVGYFLILGGLIIKFLM